MKTYNINKHGNTAVITLPAFARKELGIDFDDTLTMRVEGKKLIIEKYDADYGDKMLEELGYELPPIKITDEQSFIKSICYNKGNEHLFFNYSTRTFNKASGIYSTAISAKELKAINQKIEDLGWEE